jgi:hypothetical protein
VPSLPQIRKNLETVAPRQEDVEDDAVERLGQGAFQSCLTGSLSDDLVAVVLQAPFEALEYLALVFDNENARHVSPPSPIVAWGDERANWTAD